jgi:membrane protein DedA with SNARE-associated domain
MEHLQLWISHYGYVGIFSLLMFGIIGLPIPEETLLTLVGVLIYHGRLQAAPALTAAIGGSACGISVSYVLGRTVGPRLLTRWGRYIHLTPAALNRAHAWFERTGHWSLLVGYFLPGIRHVTALLAGASRLAPADFALFAYAGAVCWALLFVSLGALFGRSSIRLSERLHDQLAIVAIALIVIGVAGWLVRRWFERRHSPQDGAGGK